MDVEQLAVLRAHIDLENNVDAVLTQHGVERAVFLAAEAALVESLADAVDRGDIVPLNTYRIAYERIRGPAAVTDQPISSEPIDVPFDLQGLVNDRSPDGTAEIDIRAIAAALNGPTPFVATLDNVDPDETAHVNVRSLVAGLRDALPFDPMADGEKPAPRPVQKQSGATEEADLRALREHWAREVEKLGGPK